MGFGVASGEGCRHIVVHELYGACTVVRSVSCQLDLETFNRFESQFDIHFVGVGVYGRSGLSVVGHEPAAVFDLGYVGFVDESECEVKTGSQWTETACLSEHVADIGREHGNGE